MSFHHQFLFQFHKYVACFDCFCLDKDTKDKNEKKRRSLLLKLVTLETENTEECEKLFVCLFLSTSHTHTHKLRLFYDIHVHFV